MIPSRKTLSIIGSGIFALAGCIALGVGWQAYQAPRLYWSSCRFHYAPFHPAFIFEPEFRETIFGGDKSLRVKAVRGATMGDVVAIAATPERAAERANAALTDVEIALSWLQPTAVTLIEPAEPALKNRCPLLNHDHVIGLGIAAVVGLAGLCLHGIAFLRRAWNVWQDVW